VFFLPFAVPGVIAAIMWAFLLEPDLDGALDVPHLAGLARGPVSPLDYRLALYAIMLIVTWEFTGYNMTIMLTSLTSVPRQIVEAARIDGSSELGIALRSGSGSGPGSGCRPGSGRGAGAAPRPRGQL
jgi:multiple sugar transport system permease protein